jgi:hypothetical protein
MKCYMAYSTSNYVSDGQLGGSDMRLAGVLVTKMQYSGEHHV